MSRMYQFRTEYVGGPKTKVFRCRSKTLFAKF
jgi:hypothetical protein